MAKETPRAVALLTQFFAADELEHTARQTGFVKRASKITGKLFLALVTFGVWNAAKTSFAQLAVKATQVEEPVEVSPEAIHQRMNKRAIAFLQELIRQAFEKLHTGTTVCEDGLFASFAKVYLADSTGFGLPDSLKEAFPGAGGSAAQAGAKIQAVWEYKSSVFAHFALTPWNIPDNKYIDQVVALAQTGVLFLFDLGYFKLSAFARIASAGAYFLSRLNHQTNLFEAEGGQGQPLELARFLKTIGGSSLEKPILLGAKEQLPVRLIAYRLPEPVVNARRRSAKQTAKKRGYTPSHAHLELLAWNLFITNVPATIWATATVGQVYPLRWQIELIFKSWKSYLHLAALPTTTETPTLCYLYGRMLLVLLTYALYPQLRATLWEQKHRELSLLKLIRHFQAVADSWLKALFQSAFAIRRFLTQACATAERLAVKAARKRRTTAQLLRERLSQQQDSDDGAEPLAA